MALGTRRLLRDDVLVLRTYKLGEADTIVSMFGRNLGRFRAVAKGLRRTGSKFGSRLAPFCHVDVQLIEGRGDLHTVSQAVGLHLNSGVISQRWESYTVACVISEATERLVPEDGQADPDIFQLSGGALRALAETDFNPFLIRDSYLLRGMKAAGWAPSLSECAVCGREGDHRAFAVAAGGAVCSECRPGKSVVPSADAHRLLRALDAGDWRTAHEVGPVEQREVAGLVAAHFQWHSQRGLSTLRYAQR
ncbi:DNA repair protein RecO [Haloglycomyces albus]|uniref:DNA repair protein RecO n=1 Tax=Haloglycomyces albus TaxID=526067 RepID=UPI0004A3120C|nr:DNA repair protein RecO [Haloglycomyces albus]